MEKHVRKVRQQREGVRKQHVKRAHQRQVTVCSMSMLNRKRALKQSREKEKKLLLFSCFHFKRTGHKMYSQVSRIEAVCRENLLYGITRQKIIIYAECQIIQLSGEAVPQ